MPWDKDYVWDGNDCNYFSLEHNIFEDVRGWNAINLPGGRMIMLHTEVARNWLLITFVPVIILFVFGRAVVWVIDGFRR
jgi:hypothetical protein